MAIHAESHGASRRGRRSPRAASAAHHAASAPASPAARVEDGWTTLKQSFAELPAPVRWAAVAAGAVVAVRALRHWRIWAPLALQAWAIAQSAAARRAAAG